MNQVGGTSKIIYQPELTTNSYTPTTALPNGSFDVWVRPLAADGEAGLWSLVYRFQMDYRVGPETISPVGVTTDTTPTFTWRPIDGAANYDLWVNNLSTGEAQVIRKTVPHVNGAANISYTPATAMKAGELPLVGAGRQPLLESAVRGVRRNRLPDPGSVDLHTKGSARPPALHCSAGAVWTEFTTYDLWVNNLSTGLSQVICVSRDLTNKFYTPTLPLEDGQFRVWVRGFDKDGNSV